MRAVVQRVTRASVSVSGEVTGEIGQGLLVFLGVGHEDTEEDLQWLVKKVPQIRVFEDAEERMNLSVVDIGGEVLVISQFTLFGNLRKGTRPSFNHAAPPETAEATYLRFVDLLSRELGKPVPTGRFGQYMEIDALNDGPVTLFIDTKHKKL